MELWKDIEGYEGLYQISNEGRVKSSSRKYGKEKILKQSVSRKGYKKLTLHKNGVQHTYETHRLLAIAFIPNYENLPVVNHIDGVKLNNFDHNLEWLTRQENVTHAIDTGLRDNKGQKHPRSRLKDFEVLEMRKIYNSSGATQKALGIKYGVSRKHVGDIVNGRKWKHI